MPLAVVSSSSTALTINRSPKGLSFIYRPPFESLVRALGTLATRVPKLQRDPALVLGGRRRAQPLRDVLVALEDRGEADDGDRVVRAHLAAVDLLEEVNRLLDAAELRVVVLDFA